MTAGISPKNPTKYTGPNVFISSVVKRNRQPTGADYRQPETGKLYPLSSFWIIGENPISGVQGELWYLSKIVANVAFWVNVSSGGGIGGIENIQVDTFTAPGTDPVVGDAGNTITVTGGQVAAGVIGTNVIRTDSLNANTFTIEIQRSSAQGASTLLSNGVSHYNSAQFDVDANGYVSMVGGITPAILSNRVDAISGSGTNPVVSAMNGEIRVAGVLVPSGTNPIRTVSTLASEYEIQLQTSQALAASDSTKVGVSNYSALDFNVDVNGFVQSKGSASVIGVRNIGFTYNGGTGVFTIAGQDGTALSASNPAFVTLQDRSTPGLLMTIPVTANQTFIDDVGASQLIGNLFGLTAGVATTGVDIPFFLYAVCNNAENAIAFMISRFPNSTIAPISTKIGKIGSPIADTQGSFYCLPNITVTDYDLNPCIVIGSFRMRMSALNDWTVQTLLARDGIGHFQAGLQFAFPRGQFGAAAGKIFENNGGTAPDQPTGGYAYYIDYSNNRIFYQLAFPGINIAGVGAVNLQLALPFNRTEGATNGSGFLNIGAVFSSLITYTLPSSNVCEFVFINDASTGLVKNQDITVGLSISLNGTIGIEFS